MLSSPPETRVCPSGDQATLRTASECPRRASCGCPLCVFQSRRVPSLDPEARVCPSGDQATLRTASPCILLPILEYLGKVRCGCPLCAFQSATSSSNNFERNSFLMENSVCSAKI